MKSLQDLTPDNIADYSYNQLIGLVQETNRPPGGTRTIAAAARACFLAPGRHLLEIGTATGVTAIELAQLTGCTITAIDINEVSLAEARSRASAGKVDHLITFKADDATRLSFADETFDVVFCGNVTSLVGNREKSIDEYARVLRPGGLLVAVPMYYVRTPSNALVREVGNVIRVNITPHEKNYWLNLFESDNFKRLSCEDFVFRHLGEKEVAAFCQAILQRPHLKALSESARNTLETVYGRYMQLFRVNLSHMGYSVLTMVKTPPEIDPELFIADPV